MLSNRSRDTGPELAVRRLLHARGLRFRVNYRPLPDRRRTVDVAFTRAKVAVLIDGCFWHGCPEHYRGPARNADYWSTKVERNSARDSQTTKLLEEAGWRVLRYWEHQDPALVAEDVARELRDARGERA